jgi:glucose-6-phosphate 1-dehydrogenase
MSLHPPAPQAIVVFGASGDLARKKILPALYNLFAEGYLPEAFAVVGFSMSDWDDRAFRKHAKESVAEFSRTGLDATAWKAFEPSLSFVSGSFDDADRIKALGARLEEADRDAGTERGRLFYLATPPQFFPVLATQLGALPGGPGPVDRTRIVVEKPFGRDLESARELNATMHAVFKERQIFRIDHYLGKETVQNLMVFRFANSLWERVWNRDAIDHVQFTVAEDIGVEGRAAYYDGAGAIRDLIQNHMMQVTALLAMEPPGSLQPEAFRGEKVDLLQTIRPIAPRDVVRGQYVGYRDESGVAKDSTTETFAAVRLHIENWRWSGVPIFLRHGKKLPERASCIQVVFREAPSYLFRGEGIRSVPPDRLAIRIQPDEGISFSFQAKQPGPGYVLQEVAMDFSYGGSFMLKPAEAYERLMHDAMVGDGTLFTREDGVERAWEIVGRILKDPAPVHPYEPGSWGPKEADALISPREWHAMDHSAGPVDR